MAAAEVLTKEVIRAKNQKAADKWVAERVADVVRYAKDYIDGEIRASGFRYWSVIPEKFYDQVDTVYTELKAHFPDSDVRVSIDIPPTWKCWSRPRLFVRISW
jgi:hypothetical protein